MVKTYLRIQDDPSSAQVRHSCVFRRAHAGRWEELWSGHFTTLAEMQLQSGVSFGCLLNRIDRFDASQARFEPVSTPAIQITSKNAMGGFLASTFRCAHCWSFFSAFSACSRASMPSMRCCMASSAVSAKRSCCESQSEIMP